MHIAHLLMTGNPDFSGGVPSVVRQRSQYLLDQGCRVSVICMAKPGWSTDVVQDGMHIYPVRSHRLIRGGFKLLDTYSPLYLQALAGGLSRADADTPIDVVDLHDGPAIIGLSSFRRKRPVPYVFTIHGSALLNPARRSPIGRRLHIAYERSASKSAQLVLPVSNFIAGAPRSFGVDDRRIEVVPNTIPDRLFTRQPSAKAPGNRFVYVGRLVEEKRVDTILRALTRLKDLPVAVDIVGEGDARRQLQKLAAACGVADRITWHGWVANRERVFDLMSSATAFLFPTAFEAFGVALVEAMAMGVYSLGSDHPCIQDILPSHYRFALDDDIRLAEMMRDVCEGRVDQVASKDELRAAARRFTNNEVYPSLLKLYGRAVAVNQR